MLKKDCSFRRLKRRSKTKNFLSISFSASRRRGGGGRRREKNARKFFGFCTRESASVSEARIIGRQALIQNPSNLVSIHPASGERKSLPPPPRGLASRFSGKFQAVLNSVRPKAGFSKSYEILYLHTKINRERGTTSDVA